MWSHNSHVPTCNGTSNNGNALKNTTQIEGMQAHSITLCCYDFCDYCLGLLHACT
jgi:hypothetical protein